MGPTGKFIFIDDDRTEHVKFKKALKELCDNEVVSAYDGEEAFRILKKNKEKIFMIFCDINMPKINGLELKRMIESTPELKIKAIPFIFYSMHDSGIVIKQAFSLGIQGFIKKTGTVDGSVKNLDIIIKFWSTSVHPNSLD